MNQLTRVYRTFDGQVFMSCVKYDDLSTAQLGPHLHIFWESVIVYDIVDGENGDVFVVKNRTGSCYEGFVRMNPSDIVSDLLKSKLL